MVIVLESFSFLGVGGDARLETEAWPGRMHRPNSVVLVSAVFTYSMWDVPGTKNSPYTRPNGIQKIKMNFPYSKKRRELGFLKIPEHINRGQTNSEIRCTKVLKFDLKSLKSMFSLKFL